MNQPSLESLLAALRNQHTANKNRIYETFDNFFVNKSISNKCETHLHCPLCKETIISPKVCEFSTLYHPIVSISRAEIKDGHQKGHQRVQGDQRDSNDNGKTHSEINNVENATQDVHNKSPEDSVEQSIVVGFEKDVIDTIDANDPIDTRKTVGKLEIAVDIVDKPLEGTIQESHDTGNHIQPNEEIEDSAQDNNSKMRNEWPNHLLPYTKWWKVPSVMHFDNIALSKEAPDQLSNFMGIVEQVESNHTTTSSTSTEESQSGDQSSIVHSTTRNDDFTIRVPKDDETIGRLLTCAACEGEVLGFVTKKGECFIPCQRMLYRVTKEV